MHNISPLILFTTTPLNPPSLHRRYSNKIMVSDELPDGQMIDQWEPIGPDSVLTPHEVCNDDCSDAVTFVSATSLTADVPACIVRHFSGSVKIRDFGLKSRSKFTNQMSYQLGVALGRAGGGPGEGGRE